MFQKRYCIHTQFKLNQVMARVRSVACEELENYFAKGYYVVIKCAHSQIYKIIFTFLSNELV